MLHNLIGIKLFFVIIDFYFYEETVGDKSDLGGKRVIRWAAGYRVVRVRQSDRRFQFTQYPDSKISINK